MPRTPPVAWGLFPFDSTAFVAKFCHIHHDRLQSDDGWLAGGLADEIMASMVSFGFTKFHLHNYAGRESASSAAMVLDAPLLRLVDAPYMVKDFEPAWRPWGRQYEMRAYHGNQWANSRLSQNLGRDRGNWISGMTVLAYDRVWFGGSTYQTLLDHTADGSNFPGSGTTINGEGIWFQISSALKTFGSRPDRYFRRQDESIRPSLSANMYPCFDGGGGTREFDPSMGHLRRLNAVGRLVGVEASPLTGYDWLYGFDAIITSQNLPVVEATADQVNGYAALSNITGDISIIIQSEPGYGRTHLGAWSASSVTYQFNTSGTKHAVSRSGSDYFCKLTHVSDAGKEPGTPGGAAYWDVVTANMYYIPNATFANLSTWLKALITMYMNKDYSVVLDKSAFPGGSHLSDFLPDGYPGSFS